MINKIQPITISYVAGQPKTAEWFEIYSSFDNLDNAANLQWSLRENAQTPAVVENGVEVTRAQDYAGNVIQSGALACEGQDYQDWSTEPDANTWVIDWAAQELNIVLIPA
jgi:hypothetical protein